MKRVLVIAVIFLFVVTFGWLILLSLNSYVTTAFAEEQVRIFLEMRNKAASTSTVNAVQCLEYAVNHYPSGTKQKSGSRLDKLVESVRQDVCEQIMTMLKARTGKQINTVAGWSKWAKTQGHESAKLPNPSVDNKQIIFFGGINEML